MFDQMYIRQGLIRVANGKRVGYVDLGPDIAVDNETLATEALVFNVVCINKGWKLPVGYFLKKGMRAEEKSALILQGVTKLCESGMNCICKIPWYPTNSAVTKILPKSRKKLYFQTHFRHPVTQENVMMFPDPCHMLKLVRNTFGDNKYFLDENDQLISWKYFA